MIRIELDDEPALTGLAASAAGAWRDDGVVPLTVGLDGDLGAGKTTWVRALLRALGHTGRVPSPTYTLLERYEIGDLTVIHLDLYRLAEPDELEYLAVRDWLCADGTWLFAEWPGRGGRWAERLDLVIRFALPGGERRILTFEALTPSGRKAIEALSQFSSK